MWGGHLARLFIGFKCVAAYLCLPRTGDATAGAGIGCAKSYRRRADNATSPDECELPVRALQCAGREQAICLVPRSSLN